MIKKKERLPKTNPSYKEGICIAEVVGYTSGSNPAQLPLRWFGARWFGGGVLPSTHTKQRSKPQTAGLEKPPSTTAEHQAAPASKMNPQLNDVAVGQKSGNPKIEPW